MFVTHIKHKPMLDTNSLFTITGHLRRLLSLLLNLYTDRPGHICKLIGLFINHKTPA